MKGRGGDEYQAAGLGQTVSGLAEFCLPRRPAFIRDLLLLRARDAVHILGGEPQTISGPSLAWVFEEVVPLLDGTRTVAELRACLPDLAEPVLRDILHFLHMNGLLEEARPARGARRDGQLAFFSRYLRVSGRWASRDEVQGAISAATVVVTGAGGGLAAALRECGVGTVVERPGGVDPADAGAAHLVVAVGSPARHMGLAALDRPILFVDTDALRLGPLWQPGRSACPRCAALQLDDGPAADRPTGDAAGLWARALLARAAQQVLAHVTGLFTPQTLNHREEWRPGTREVVRRPLVRLPGCPACGSTGGLPPTLRLPSGHTDSLALTFHWAAVLPPWQIDAPASQQLHFSSSVQDLMAGAHLRHDWAASLPLPEVRSPVPGTAARLWRADPSPPPPPPPGAAELAAALLRLSAGAVVSPLRNGGHHFQRYTASAGNLGSAELYLCATARSGALPPGLYHYRLVDDALERLGDLAGEDIGSHLARVPAAPPPLWVVVVSAVERQYSKYAERGYILCLLDAGLMAHRVELLARVLGWRAECHWDFADGGVAAVLGVDGERLAPTVVIALRSGPEGPGG